MNSRRKGAVGERELAAYLRSKGFEARRGQQFSGSPDSPDVLGLPGFHIECKRVERLNVYDAMGQAEADCGLSMPIVVHRRNRSEWLVTLRLDHFLEIRNAAKETRAVARANREEAHQGLRQVEGSGDVLHDPGRSAIPGHE